MNNAQETAGRRWTLAFMLIFSAVSVGLLVYTAATQRWSFFMRGIFFPLFLLIPPLFRRLGLQHCWQLYCLLYAFITFAFSFGCVYGAFTSMAYMDKVSHFLSGFVFTIVGFCIYYLLAGPKSGGMTQDWALSSSYALFFSMFIAVMWEVCEYFDFAFTGNDSQNHLTTGVFDTMHDLMACLVASLLCAAAFVLFRFARVKLVTAAVVEEFYDKNVAGKPPRSKG